MMAESTSPELLAELNKELRPLQRRDVLWAVCIIVGLSMAPAVADIYSVYFM